LPSLHGGGAENVMLILARGFQEEGYDVEIVLGKAEGPYLVKVPKECKLVDLRSSHVSLAFPKLVSYLRRAKPVALFSTMSHANVIAILARKFAMVPSKVIVREANTVSKSLINDRKWRSRILPFLMRFLYPSADKIIAPSIGVLQDLVKTLQLSEKRVHLIHNPTVTPELFVQKEIPLVHPWFQPEEPAVVLGAGRLSPQKDFRILIRAFAKAVLHKNLRLVILGEGPERDKLETIIQESCLADKISLPGFVTNPYNYMKNSALFVLSSKWEGLPNVLIEAMACGLPVVSTNCPSGPAEILENGKYGELVPVGDVSKLSQAILKGVVKKKSSAYCGELVKRSKCFSTNKIIEKYINCIIPEIEDKE